MTSLDQILIVNTALSEWGTYDEVNTTIVWGTIAYETSKILNQSGAEAISNIKVYLPPQAIITHLNKIKLEDINYDIKLIAYKKDTRGDLRHIVVYL
jgi:hypothetical protein